MRPMSGAEICRCLDERLENFGAKVRAHDRGVPDSTLARSERGDANKLQHRATAFREAARVAVKPVAG